MESQLSVSRCLQPSTGVRLSSTNPQGERNSGELNQRPPLFLQISMMGLSSTRRAAGVMTRFTSRLHSHATSFGFKQVGEGEKKRLVENVFTNVASKYDIMNDVMSVGLHRLWKDRLVSMLHPFPGMNHLDVAGGTGDIAFRILESVKKQRGRNVDDEYGGEEAQIFVCDINRNMLDVGKKRALQKGIGGRELVWVEGDAEALVSFEDESMDGYTIAFGMRNVTHIDKALSEAYRVLKRGGRFLCLELSHVSPDDAPPLFSTVYDLYSFHVIPALGELVVGDRNSYQYLVESIRRFPPQRAFASLIAGAGFQKITYQNLLSGVVAIHSAFKL